MRICSYLLKKFLAGNFIFCALICVSIETENYCKEENNLFSKKLCCFNIHIFCEFFTAQCLDVRFWDLSYFYLFEVLSTGLASPSQGEMNWLSSYF